MKKFKVLGAKSLYGAYEYCQLTVVAENEMEAEKKFLAETRFYDVLRVDEIEEN